MNVRIRSRVLPLLQHIGLTASSVVVWQRTLVPETATNSVARRFGDLEIRRGEKSDLAALNALHGEDSAITAGHDVLYEQFLDEGAVWAVGFANRELVYSSILARTPTIESSTGLVVGAHAGESTILDSYTHPGWRRRGFHKAGVKFLVDEARTGGLRSVCACAHVTNPAAHGAFRANAFLKRAAVFALHDGTKWRYRIRVFSGEFA